MSEYDSASESRTDKDERQRAKRDHKVVVLGDSGSGKSSVIIRGVKNAFDDEIELTMGIDFFTKTYRTEKKEIRVQIWDTAGQERFRSIIGSYVRGCDNALLIYDISDRKSFEALDEWVEKIREEKISDNVKMWLVGNKSDLSEEREVQKLEAVDKAAEFGVSYCEVSAKTGAGIAKLMDAVCVDGAKRLVLDDDEATVPIAVKDENEPETVRLGKDPNKGPTPSVQRCC
eukprot:525420_1